MEVIDNRASSSFAVVWEEGGTDGASSSPTSREEHVFHYVWLRDNCGCSKCVHPTSLQKMHSSSSIQIDVSPSSHHVQNDTLHVKWSDGHESIYTLQWLKKYDYTKFEPLMRRREQIKPSLWRASEINEEHSVTYAAFMEDEKALAKALRVFLDYGILFISGVPIEAGSIEKVATRIGPIRETFYGRSWDVKNVPNANNIAFTAVDLGLHQDLVYYESVPPVQLLHCMRQSNNGGESVFVDSYHGAEKLRVEHPQHFETLLKVPVIFKCSNSGHNFYCQKPILYQNENLYIGVNFSPQNYGPLKVAQENVLPFYAAHAHFSHYLQSDELVLKRKLAEGELVMFDNRRVLHGRAYFDPSEPRHLRGCYLGMDEVQDRYYTIQRAN